MKGDLNSLRIIYRTFSDDRLKKRLESLQDELEDSRDVTSHSDTGQSYASERHVHLLSEIRAVTDVMVERGLLNIRRDPRGAIPFVSPTRRFV